MCRNYAFYVLIIEIVAVSSCLALDYCTKDTTVSECCLCALESQCNATCPNGFEIVDVNCSVDDTNVGQNDSFAIPSSPSPAIDETNTQIAEITKTTKAILESKQKVAILCRKCSNGYYLDDDNVTHCCDPVCFGCKGPGRANCIKCRVVLEGECVESCPSTGYIDNVEASAADRTTVGKITMDFDSTREITPTAATTFISSSIGKVFTTAKSPKVRQIGDSSNDVSNVPLTRVCVFVGQDRANEKVSVVVIAITTGVCVFFVTAVAISVYIVFRKRRTATRNTSRLDNCEGSYDDATIGQARTGNDVEIYCAEDAGSNSLSKGHKQAPESSKGAKSNDVDNWSNEKSTSLPEKKSSDRKGTRFKEETDNAKVDKQARMTSTDENGHHAAKESKETNIIQPGLEKYVTISFDRKETEQAGCLSTGAIKENSCLQTYVTIPFDRKETEQTRCLSTGAIKENSCLQTYVTIPFDRKETEQTHCPSTGAKRANSSLQPYETISFGNTEKGKKLESYELVKLEQKETAKK